MRQRVIEREPDKAARDWGCGAGHLERSVIGQACVVGVVFAEVIAGDLNEVVGGVFAEDRLLCPRLTRRGLSAQQHQNGRSVAGRVAGEQLVADVRVEDAREPRVGADRFGHWVLVRASFPAATLRPAR